MMSAAHLPLTTEDEIELFNRDELVLEPNRKLPYDEIAPRPSICYICWTLAMALPWWQHYKYRRGYYYYYYYYVFNRLRVEKERSSVAVVTGDKHLQQDGPPAALLMLSR